jgi:hypothetical protein
MSDPVSELKQELLAAAERRHERAAAPAGPGWSRALLGRSRLLVAAATVPIAAAVTLLVSTPWNDSPGFLARAEAALTPPAGTILHQKLVATTTSVDPPCTVTHDPNEIWIDQTPPHAFRALLNVPAPGTAEPRTLACSRGTGPELGGAFDTGETLMFVPPNTLSNAPGRFLAPLDPVGDLREGISAGSAHDEGKTQLDGRTVERIRIDPPSDWPFGSCPREPTYWYVDPETFYPVETHGGLWVIATGPSDGAMPPVICARVSMRYLTFEYLPRTAANLALTDIRAQHPDATGP